MSNRPNTRSRPRTSSVNRAAQTAEPGRRPWWIAGVVVGLAALAGIVAMAAGSGGDDIRELPGGTIPGGAEAVPSSDDTYGEVAVQGTPLAPATPGGGADLAVGQSAPTVTGTGLHGDDLRIPVEGRPTVIAFLAHWCPHCQDEVPALVNWFEDEGLPDDVDLVAVATANDRSATNALAGRWLHREAWPVPTLLDDDDDQAGTAFGVSGFPYFVAVDADGAVVGRTSGSIGVAGVEQLIAAARG